MVNKMRLKIIKEIILQIESREKKLKKEMRNYTEPEINQFYARINELKELKKYIKGNVILSDEEKKERKQSFTQGRNISQVFDEELAKLTDKNITDIFSVKNITNICKKTKTQR